MYRSSRAIYTQLAPLVDEPDRARLLSRCIATVEGVCAGHTSGRDAAGRLLSTVGVEGSAAVRLRALIDREIAFAVAARELSAELGEARVP